MNKKLIKKAIVLMITLVTVTTAFMPAVNSHFKRSSDLPLEKNGIIKEGSSEIDLDLSQNIVDTRNTNQPSFDGLLDDVYSTHGHRIYYGNTTYQNASANLYVLDNTTIDPSYVWIAWVTNPSYVDNTYGNGTVPQYVNKQGKPTSHNFEDLYGSDRQEIKLYDGSNNCVFYASMDIIHTVGSAPSGYGVPAWGFGDSNVYSGDSGLVEYETSTAWDVNNYYTTPPYDVLTDSPTLGDQNYTLFPGYENWEHRLIYELKVDRNLFGGSTINASATEFPESHYSPNKIGPHDILMEPLPPIYYTINATAGSGGSISPSGTVYVNYGDDQTFTITPDTGYHIDDVLVDGSSVGAVSSYTFYNVTADHTIEAQFAEDEYYTLTVIVDGNGIVTKDPDQTTYTYGIPVELEAFADPGWTFDHWSGDLTGNTNPDTIIMDDNKEVTAHFINDEDTEPPSVRITQPINALYIFDRPIVLFSVPIIIKDVTIEVDAYDNESGIERVEFYIDGELQNNDTTAPYSWLWKDKSILKHTIKVIAYDNAGNSAIDDIIVWKWRFHPILICLVLLVGFIFFSSHNLASMGEQPDQNQDTPELNNPIYRSFINTGCCTKQDVNFWI